MYRYAMFMLLYVCCPPGLWIHAAEDETCRVDLAWHENGFSAVVKTDISKDSEPFRVEPEVNDKDVWRGTVEVGPEPRKETLALIWLPSQGRLYLDLNRDGDLTNDSVLEQIDEEHRSEFLQEFPSVPLSLISEKGEYRYRLQPVLIDTGKYHFAYIKVVSGYSGVIELKGKQYHIGIVDHLKGTIEREDNITISSVSLTDPNLVCEMDVPENIFVADRLYRLTFEFHKHESGFPLLQCILTEQDAQFGRLRIECPQLKQLILADDKTLVICDVDQQISDIPVGTYSCRSLVWDNLSPAYVHRVNITPDREYRLVAGGPLRSSVDVWRTGNILQMHYLLLGAGDERYNVFEVNGFDYKKRPSVAIYRGHVQVASGKFEYG
ncbi:MAG: hypothetical protein LLF76_12860 [Planctomycetaceae bacterium]|nr:hypothetical protein [Planctomycetaceae bacterium]